MAKQIDGNIKHIVVLMFENRSFDHMLGGMPGVNGVLLPDGTVNPACYNTMSPTHAPDSIQNKPVYSTPIDLSGQAGLTHDFNHDFGDGMMPDLFGPGTTGYLDGKPVNAPAVTYPGMNSGFLSTVAYNVNVAEAEALHMPVSAGKDPLQQVHPVNGPSSMYFFENGSLKVFHQLASEFVVCDNWYCDMPGHTQPNRCFMHCATSGNMGIDETNTGMELSKTIFQQIEGMGYDWKMYTPGGWWRDSTFLAGIVNSPYADVPIDQFCKDLQNGTLPFYSFLMPGLGADPDTSMHPASRVEPGENYLAAVYNALRVSPYWENTLLIVNFDENGGIYDHVMPPQAATPDPLKPISYATNNNGTQAEFDFSLLGPRIPTLLISPWLFKGIDSTQYQNTSILRYLQDLISGSTGLFLNLTQRDAKAPSIVQVFDSLGSVEPRTDCPLNIEGYPGVGGGNICDADAFTPTPAYLQRPPLPHTLTLATEYLGGLPGHADSGKPFPKSFTTNGELHAYAQERIDAAKAYVLENPV